MNQNASTTEVQRSSSSESESSSESAENNHDDKRSVDKSKSEHEQRDKTSTHNATKSATKLESVHSSESDSSESDSSESEHVIKAKHVVFNNKGQSRPVTETDNTNSADTKKQTQRSAGASHVPQPPLTQRRGESLGRGYRAPQWPWLPFTVAAHSDAAHTSHVTDQTRVALSSLQREDVIAFRTMELDGWQPVLSPVKQATVRAVTPHSVRVRLLTGVSTESEEEVTFAAEDLTELTVVNKHS